MADETLAVSTTQLSQLAETRTKPKYVDEPGTLYNGLRPESARQRAEAQLNDLIDRLHIGLVAARRKHFVLSEFEKTLAEFEPADTEDRECLLRFLESIMDTLGIESSDVLLDRWLFSMTEDEFWTALEWRICRELNGMSDAVLRPMWCDGIRGAIMRPEAGPAYMFGTIYIGKTGQTAMEFRMTLPDNITSKDDIVWSQLMPPADMTAWLSVDYSKRKLVMIDLSKAEPIVI